MANRQCALCHRTSRTHKIGKESGVCSTCDVALIYWNGRTTTQKMKRAKQLDSFQARMDVSLGNVKRMKRKTG